MRVSIALFVILLLAGCTAVLDIRRPDLRISIVSAPETLHDHVFRVEVEGRLHELPLGASPLLTHAPRRGDLEVSASLLTPSRTPLARTGFRQRYYPGSNHWVSAMVGAERPIGNCMGELIAVPIEPAGTDTLFVMYGNLSKDAIC